MKAFNAFYYSFSPAIASVVMQYPVLQNTVRTFLYPLIMALHSASSVFNTLGLAPELAVTASGLVASALIGVAYLTPLAAIASLCSKRLRRRH